MRVLPLSLVSVIALALAPARTACAQAAPDLGVSHVMDVVAVANGDETRVYWLNNLDLTADLALTGGTSFHADVLVNLGGMPNDAAGTLQGINNIEVASH